MECFEAFAGVGADQESGGDLIELRLFMFEFVV